MGSNLRKRLSQTIKRLRQLGKLIGDIEGRYFYCQKLYICPVLCYNEASLSFKSFEGSPSLCLKD